MKTINVLVTLLLVVVIGMASANAGGNTQEVNVAVGNSTGLDVSPASYDYGDVGRGQCSDVNPEGNITINNTGTADLNITIVTTGIFLNIYYNDGGGWMDANNFTTQVNNNESENIDTKIYIPTSVPQSVHTGNVTFEYYASAL